MCIPPYCHALCSSCHPVHQVRKFTNWPNLALQSTPQVARIPFAAPSVSQHSEKTISCLALFCCPLGGKCGYRRWKEFRGSLGCCCTCCTICVYHGENGHLILLALEIIIEQVLQLLCWHIIKLLVHNLDCIRQCHQMVSSIDDEECHELKICNVNVTASVQALDVLTWWTGTSPICKWTLRECSNAPV